jgi:hypothetical protein
MQYHVACSHSDDYEENGVLGCDAMQFGKTPTFWRNISPQSSGGGQKTSRTRRQNNFIFPPASVTFLFILLFDLEDGVDIVTFLGV